LHDAAVDPGIGLLTATALVAATSGDVSHFKDARHFASWFGLTPKEYSSGGSRYLGHISKRGDRYLRMLLTHGARSVLRAAAVAQGKGREVHGVRHWALAGTGPLEPQQGPMRWPTSWRASATPRCATRRDSMKRSP
jgi:transposase